MTAAARIRNDPSRKVRTGIVRRTWWRSESPADIPQDRGGDCIIWRISIMTGGFILRVFAKRARW